MSVDALIGHSLRQYELLEWLGSGTFGTVYRARHRDLRLDRALKILRDEWAHDPGLRERFVHEARTAAVLRHPNVVAVYDVFEEAGRLCIVMDLAPSRTLADRLRTQGRLEPREAVRLASAVAAALDYAHVQGIVHRDVKPANILLREDGEALLSDFGVAWHPADPTLTTTASAIGTLGYMAPEQLAGSGQRVDARSDTYSLAVVLYEMVTGRPPYGRGAEAVPGHLGQRSLPPARGLNPRLPPAVDAVLARGLARLPADRYQSARALVRDFAAALSGEPWRVWPAPVPATVTAAPAPPPPPAPRRAAAPPPAPPRRRRRGRLGLGVALTAMVAVGLLAIASNGGSRPVAPRVDRLARLIVALAQSNGATPSPPASDGTGGQPAPGDGAAAPPASSTTSRAPSVTSGRGGVSLPGGRKGCDPYAPPTTLGCR